VSKPTGENPIVDGCGHAGGHVAGGPAVMYGGCWIGPEVGGHVVGRDVEVADDEPGSLVCFQLTHESGGGIQCPPSVSRPSVDSDNLDGVAAV
jgi:hypothetical protein